MGIFDFLNWVANLFPGSIYVFLILIFLIVIIIICYMPKFARKRVDKENRMALDMSPKEFNKLRNKRSMLIQNAVMGKKQAAVYVLRNETKDKYLVGQSQDAYNRVNMHLTGAGDDAVYKDYKSGDSFRISIITLGDTDYSNLTDLEKEYLKKYASKLYKK